MPQAILGVSAYYHDSSAAILIDGELIAAVQEERFTRKKYDSSFPSNAIEYVLSEAGITYNDLTAVSFYDKPYLKFERLLETYHAFAPNGLKSFLTSIPVWIKEKLFMKQMLRDELAKLGDAKIPLLFPEHHLSHAASAFFPSPFDEAAILTIDGVGEWATATLGYGSSNQIKILKELHFPHSVGLLYSAFTYYTGFQVNSGEYKLMGLAPYGNPNSKQTQEFKEKILNRLVDIRDDGSILLNMSYFDFATGLTMSNNKKWLELFGIPPREPESEISQVYMNMAFAIQQVTEEIVLRLSRNVRALTNSKNLVLAGGVALNSVANGKILKEKIFDNIWIQPAAGDAGGALGAAYSAWLLWKNNPRKESNSRSDLMKGAFLGPEFHNPEIIKSIKKFNAKYKSYNDFSLLVKDVAGFIAEGKVVSWFQGRMEFGPRALGNRSILGDARNPEMQKKMNLKIKYREGFRPFAPSVLEDDLQKYFELDVPSPYMLLVVPVEKNRLKPIPEDYAEKPLYERLYYERSDIPAVTHLDYSARVQSVSKETNPRFYELINEFKKLTGCSVIVNTSFNIRGEPIVCTPEDAYKCFMRTEMDYLVMGDLLFTKNEQTRYENDGEWKTSFKLD